MQVKQASLWYQYDGIIQIGCDPLTAFFAAFWRPHCWQKWGDKTQLVTLTLSTATRRYVSWPGRWALSVITGIAVILGDFLAELLPTKVTMIASGLFLAVGIYLASLKVKMIAVN